MIVRKTTQSEGKRVNELFAMAFELPLSSAPADPNNQKIYHWAAFAEDGQTMMSTLSISDYSIRFDGHSCRMGGVGGVATLPPYRRMGGIRGCFEAALPAMYRESYDFSYLYPFSTEYYRKFGYECCVQKMGWEVNLALLKPQKTEGHLCLAEGNTPLWEAVMTLDRQWENKYNMMVIHEEPDYKWCRNAAPAEKLEFTYIYFDPQNTPKAYTTFRTASESDGRNLICSRFCFADAEGFHGLMDLFKRFSSDHTLVKFKTPYDPALQYLMPEWSLGAVRWSVLANAGMVRIINVRSALEKARYLGSGTITLKIIDPQIRENNQTFSVTFSDGCALRVTETQEVPDAVLTISTFSAMLAGVCDASSAKEIFGGIDVLNPDACFAQVFYRKPMMIVDYF